MLALGILFIGQLTMGYLNTSFCVCATHNTTCPPEGKEEAVAGGCAAGLANVPEAVNTRLLTPTHSPMNKSTRLLPCVEAWREGPHSLEILRGKSS